MTAHTHKWTYVYKQKIYRYLPEFAFPVMVGEIRIMECRCGKLDSRITTAYPGIGLIRCDSHLNGYLIPLQ
jgi:hypothetical protein